jgi:hypothetical protein
MQRRRIVLCAFLALALACYVDAEKAEKKEEGKAEAKPMVSVDHEIKNISVSMAFTLIACLSFLMVLFYFLNSGDPDIKELSWDSLNQTISIFVAVLSFSAFNDWAEAYFIGPLFCSHMAEEEWEEAECQLSGGAVAVDFSHMMFWFIVMQILCGVLARAAPLPKWMPAALQKIEEIPEDEEELEELKETMEIRVKCGSTLAAHITGFAAINCFSTVQDKWFSSSPITAGASVLTTLLFMLIIQRIFDEIREYISKDGDATKDEFEELWDERPSSHDDRGPAECSAEAKQVLSNPVVSVSERSCRGGCAFSAMPTTRTRKELGMRPGVLAFDRRRRRTIRVTTVVPVRVRNERFWRRREPPMP